MEKYNSASTAGTGFVDTLMATLQEPELLSRPDLKIRVRSPIKLKLSPSRVRLLENLVRKLSSFHRKIESTEKAANGSASANITTSSPHLASFTIPMTNAEMGSEHVRTVTASIAPVYLVERGTRRSTAIQPHDLLQCCSPRTSAENRTKIHPSNQNIQNTSSAQSESYHNAPIHAAARVGPELLC